MIIHGGRNQTGQIYGDTWQLNSNQGATLPHTLFLNHKSGGKNDDAILQRLMFTPVVCEGDLRRPVQTQPKTGSGAH